MPVRPSMLPPDALSAEVADVTSEFESKPWTCTAAAAGGTSELGSTEATEGASEPEPARRHRVSRRIIVRARNKHLAERRALREGGARAAAEGADGGSARAPSKGTGGGAGPQAAVQDASGFDVAFVPMAAGIPSAPLAHSQTAGVSNTVCISNTPGQLNTGMQAARDLAQLGEIARIDFGLASIRDMLVTYFDVRDAQTALLRLASCAAPFPQAAQDSRVVLVDVAGFCAKTGRTAGFQDFGEVANVDVVAGQLVVEFYDLRSAQALLAAAGDCATLVPSSAFAPPAAPPCLEHPVVAPVKAGPIGVGSAADGAAQQVSDETKHRTAQTKVAHADLRAFDISPEAILRGQDKRTTVMVRHLHREGLCSGEDLRLLLGRCGLGDRYSFFYMPHKGGRLTGLAFVNFASPLDVCTLHAALASGLQQDACGRPPANQPAVSYARFQGHEELVRHFRVSAVLQEPDPEKRPIFRPEVLIH